ncbi:hypothetical protein PT2222_400011 [Paraburkholderia tropica]
MQVGLQHATQPQADAEVTPDRLENANSQIHYATAPASAVARADARGTFMEILQT